MSRLDFSVILAREFKLDEKLLRSISISDFNWKSKRPKNGGLNVEKISKILNTKLLSTLESLKQMKIDSQKM